MTSPGDQFSFGSLPHYGRKRPPRREFGMLVIALVLVATLAVSVRLITGTASKATAAASPSPSPAVAASHSGNPGSPQPAPDLMSKQMRKILDLGKPVYCGGNSQPMVALTFDDGPGPYTQYTIDTLRAAGAKATFFLVGRLFSSTTDQRESKVEARFGDVGNHSWNHFGLAGKPRSVLQSEVLRPLRTIEKYSGEHVVLFRPPWGSRDAALDDYVRSLGMIEVMWTFDTHDSEGAKTDEIIHTIDKLAKPGSIILLHENRGTTRNALPAILQVLASKGLRPVTLTTLLTQDPPTTKQLKQGQAGCFD